MNTIDRFDGDYRFLSNFYYAPVFHRGLWFPTTEHAYQAAKTDDEEIRQGFTQLRSPGAAKKIGQLIPIRENWDDEHRLDVMREVLALKFVQGSDLANRLLLTHHDVLIEGNRWHDRFFGVCICDKHKGIGGANWLGCLLMERREQLWGAVTT